MSEVPLYTVNAWQPALAATEYSLSMQRADYRGITLIRNRAPLRPYSRIMSRALWWPYGGRLFLMSKIPLYSLSLRRADLLSLIATFQARIRV